MEYMDETTLAHKHTSPWLIAFRIIFTIALVWCILFIFHNSLETSSISSARSHEVMQKINAILAHLNIGPLSEHVVRKLAHFSEFTLEGFLLMLCLRVYTRRFVRHVSWPMLGGMATALLDETIQLYVPGRTSSVRDVWIDFGGVIAGLFVALLLLLIVRRPAIRSPRRCTSTLPPLMRLARLATWRAYSMGELKGWVKRMVESSAKLEFLDFFSSLRKA